VDTDTDIDTDLNTDIDITNMNGISDKSLNNYEENIEENKKENREEKDKKDYKKDDSDGLLKTKRRGRKPKDKFKYETTDIDEYQRNTGKEDNIIIKLPLSCLKLNEEFNIGKDLYSYNPNITTPTPYNSGELQTHGIAYSLIDFNDNISDDKDLQNNNDTQDNNIQNSKDTQNNNDIQNANATQNNSIQYDNDIYEETNNMSEKYCKCECECKTKKTTLLTVNNNKNNGDKNNGDKNNGDKNNDIGECSEKLRQIDIILSNKYNSNTDKFNVLTQFGTNFTGGKWIDKTDIACLWCCNSFTNTPWGIPYKFINETFQLFGNFCSANCTLAYILQNYKNDDTIWEKIALLNLLYFKVYKIYKNLIPAFDKMALKMFGGTLDIDEFRTLTSNNDKAYNIEFPPCNTIIPMLEEIYKKTNLNNNFIPIDKTRIQIANNELKLKRSKPVVNHKNTLDFCLGKS
jgi:thiol-disulfide isomerase/thioredoxin